MKTLGTIKRLILYMASALFVGCVIWTLNGGIISVLIGTFAAVLITSIGADISELTE